jgi:hypothetical protein
MANCLETWISDNPDAEFISRLILEEIGCGVDKITLPDSLTTMTKLKSIDLYNINIIGSIPVKGWENLVDLVWL